MTSLSLESLFGEHSQLACAGVCIMGHNNYCAIVHNYCAVVHLCLLNDHPHLHVHTSMPGQERERSFTQESGCRDTVPWYAYEAQNPGACMLNMYLLFKLVLGIFSALVSNMQTDRHLMYMQFMLKCSCVVCRGCGGTVISTPACVQRVVCFL